ncbi:hypothetical protein [Arthrobacter sp. FW306-2-2C-D06B]|uniref:hypothetical protein n=1 Tax=Arthrobacter sp. FW306-2-2C-D06B TaxID=2879618 RepID=UPI001F47A0E7|nr:hypothetical protein [Arthrobacter sp. FW306-2-2C-D06B]UKA57361.1 hypothetical protein LFT47_13740 [Arthrobacter sp. FW306-2-2C-D06B]
MKRTIATLGVVGLGLLGATVSANAAPSDKITICHATHSASNPYVEVTISLSALSKHVLDTNDIVPANSGDFMPHGQNLTTENVAILNAGCLVVKPPVDPVVSPPVTTSPPVDPVVSPPVTTSPPVDPVVSPPVTTSPPVDPVVNPPVTTSPPSSPPVDPVVNPPVTTSPPSSPAGPVEQLEPVVPPAVTPMVPPVVAPPAPVAAPAPAATPAAGGTPAGAAAAPDAPITNVGYNVQTAVGGKTEAGIPGWLVGLTGLFSPVAAFAAVRIGVRARGAHR